VELRDNLNNIIATQLTSSGAYLFDNLTNGNYTVVITDTNNVLSNYSLTSGVNPHKNIIIDAYNQIRLDIDFGYRKTVQVPLFDNAARMLMVFILFFGAAFMLYRQERHSYM
jgi:hypothetical protein